jgi:hypothetical protein
MDLMEKMQLDYVVRENDERVKNFETIDLGIFLVTIDLGI